jgi:uncharacterized membrane protein
MFSPGNFTVSALSIARWFGTRCPRAVDPSPAGLGGYTRPVSQQAQATHSKASPRIRAFDWLRGLAVLLMIQCHALVLLKPPLRMSAFYRWLDFVDGLVAPAFIFAAGFSLALVQVRGATGGARATRVMKTLRRISEVLLVASLLNSMWFPVRQEPKWLLRIDILHCIGLALLVALPLLALLATRPNLLRWVCLALAIVVFALAPLVEPVRGPWARLLNHHTGSVFPLFPWAGYVYLGASVGVVAASGSPRAILRWLLLLWAICIAVWLATPLFLKLYPPHEFWITNPANHARRLAMVFVGVLLLVLLEWKVEGAWMRSSPVRFIEAIGTSSLSAYFFHQALLYYQVFGFSFHSWWGDRCNWWQYGVLTVALIAATFLLSQLTDLLYRPFNVRANRLLESLALPEGNRSIS